MRNVWKKTAVLAALCTVGSSLVFAGCSKSKTAPPVLAEKTESAQKESMDAGTSLGEEKEGAEEALESLWERTEAPERYETELEAGQVHVSADAVLEIPDGKEIPAMELVKQPYTRVEYETIKKIFSSIWHMEWGEDLIHEVDYDSGNETIQGVYSADGNYYLSFWDGEGDRADPIVWLTRETMMAAGSLSDFSKWENVDTEEEREKIEEALKEQSEAFMEQMDSEEMTLTDSHWVEISIGKGRGDVTVPGLLLMYRRSLNGIPIQWTQPSVLGENSWAGVQYFRFIYTADQEPVEIMDISREEFKPLGTHTEFLLPFAAVAQIFEQHCKVRETPYETIRVTRVALEYRYDGDSYGNGRIFPVWSFYGDAWGGESDLELKSPVISMREQGKESLLVSIGAEDGGIY